MNALRNFSVLLRHMRRLREIRYLAARNPQARRVVANHYLAS